MCACACVTTGSMCVPVSARARMSAPLLPPHLPLGGAHAPDTLPSPTCTSGTTCNCGVCVAVVWWCATVCALACACRNNAHTSRTPPPTKKRAHTHTHTRHTHAHNTHAHGHLYDVSASPPPQLSLTPTTLVPLNHHQCDQTPQSFKPPPLFRTRARARVSKRRSRATIPDPGPRGPSPACPGALPATTTPVRSDPRRSGRSSLPTWQLQ